MVHSPKGLLLTNRRSRVNLVSRICAFLRHTIPTVRLACASILESLVINPSFSTSEWINDRLLSMLFQNLILEQRHDVRQVTFTAFEAACSVIAASAGGLSEVMETVLEDFVGLVMTSIGQPIDNGLFVTAAKRTGGHNVDKGMMEGDVGLVGMEVMLQSRIAGAKAVALMMGYKAVCAVLVRLQALTLQDFVARSLVPKLQSGSAHEIMFASIVVQEWAAGTSSPMAANQDVIKSLSQSLVGLIDAPPLTYTSMSTILMHIQADCRALLSAFITNGKVPKGSVPRLPSRIDAASSGTDVFTLSTAQQVVGPTYDHLVTQLSKSAAKHVLPSLQERQRKILTSIGYFVISKERYDSQVGAAVAGALVAIRVMPGKFGGVVKAFMDGIKVSEHFMLCSRLLMYSEKRVRRCNHARRTIWHASSLSHSRLISPSKRLQRTKSFEICSRSSARTLRSLPSSMLLPLDILTLRETVTTLPIKKGAAKEAPEESEEQIAMRITRRGAAMAFKALASRFGDELFDKVPKAWEGLSGALETHFGTGETRFTGGLVADGARRCDRVVGRRFKQGLTGRTRRDRHTDVASIVGPGSGLWRTFSTHRAPPLCHSRPVLRHRRGAKHRRDIFSGPMWCDY